MFRQGWSGEDTDDDAAAEVEVAQVSVPPGTYTITAKILVLATEGGNVGCWLSTGDTAYLWHADGTGADTEGDLMLLDLETFAEDATISAQCRFFSGSHQGKGYFFSPRLLATRVTVAGA